jgi:hypothetical protein
MLVRSECQRCGNIRLYRASDLMMVFGGGRDPLTLRFRCAKCFPDIKVTFWWTWTSIERETLSSTSRFSMKANWPPGCRSGSDKRGPSREPVEKVVSFVVF